jgi:hypothetical protein
VGGRGGFVGEWGEGWVMVEWMGAGLHVWLVRWSGRREGRCYMIPRDAYANTRLIQLRIFSKQDGAVLC